MRDTMTIIAYLVIAGSFLAFLLEPFELAQEFIQARKAYKDAKHLLEHNIRVWESVAKSCDPIYDAFDKGYAIARLVIYHHELDELIEDRKRELCS